MCGEGEPFRAKLVLRLSHGEGIMGADEYRRNAIECLRIADETISARSRVLLIHMAEAWLRLADQAEKNLTTDLVYETPPPHALCSARTAPTGSAQNERLVKRHR